VTPREHGRARLSGLFQTPDSHITIAHSAIGPSSQCSRARLLCFLADERVFPGLADDLDDIHGPRAALEQTSNGPRGAACLARVLDDVEWRELDATDPKSWLGRTLRASSSASVYPLAPECISSQAAEIASLADSSPSAHGGSTMTSSKPIASTWGRTAIISLNACGLRAASAPSENHLPLGFGCAVSARSRSVANVANGTAAKTAETDETRCRGLRPAVAEVAWCLGRSAVGSSPIVAVRVPLADLSVSSVKQRL
jgi:hypothetical protein